MDADLDLELPLIRYPPYLSRIYQACYYCHKPQSSDEPLSRCSRCRRVCYDSIGTVAFGSIAYLSHPDARVPTRGLPVS